MKKLSAVKITRFFNYLKQFNQGILDKILKLTVKLQGTTKTLYDSSALARYQYAYKHMEKEFTKNTSIIIQGPVYDSEFVTKNYRYYTNLGYQVVVSTWDSDGKWQEAMLPDDILVYSEGMEYRSRIIDFLHPYFSIEKGEDVYSTCTNYYQALSTLNGFKLIKPEGNVIKIRTDEFYSNLSLVEEHLGKMTFPKYICCDTFAIHGEQPSDHLIATTGQALYDTCKFIVNKYRSTVMLTKRTSFKPYQEGYSIEQELFNAFLLSTDAPTHTGDIEDIFDMYCTILNKEDLEDYIVKWNTRKKVFTNIK